MEEAARRRDGLFSVEAVAYDNGQDEAAVHTVCTGGTNFGYNEVFVYTTSPGGP